MGAHEDVRDELVRVIQTGDTWNGNISINHAGGEPGDTERPHTYPSAGSQNWNNMAWVGEGLGRKGYGTIDTWHLCALHEREDIESNSIGLFNTEVGSSIYDRWTAASSFLASVPDQRGICELPPTLTQYLARRVSAAYAAFFTLHAIDRYPEEVHCFLHKDQHHHEVEDHQTLPWIIAAQNRGVAKNNEDKWPHCSNPNGFWLALALDWPDRVKIKGDLNPNSADWWLWAMQEITQLDYCDTWPAKWFGFTEEDRCELREFIKSDGEHGPGRDALLRLAGTVPVRKKYEVKRWPGRLVSWIPSSSNSNNPAVLAAEWCEGQTRFYAPCHFYTGETPIYKGEAYEPEDEPCVICKGDDDVELRSMPYPQESPTLNAQWSQQKGLLFRA